MMAIQILPRRIDPLADLAGSAGQGVGAGIISGLERMQQQQLQQQQMQRTAQGLLSFGFTPQEAMQIAQLPPELQKQVITQRQQQLQAQSMARSLGLSGQSSPQQGNVQQGGNFGGISPESLAGLSAEQVFGLYKQRQGEAQKAREFEAAQQKQLSSEIQKSHQLHKPRLDTIATQGTEAKTNLENIEKIRGLLTTGKIQGINSLKAIGDKFGVGGFLVQAETELAQKLMQRIVMSEGAASNGRLTDDKLRALEKANVSLANTPQGMKLIMEEMENELQKRVAVDKARAKVIKQYEGKALPFNIEDLIRDEASKDFERINSNSEKIQKKYAHYALKGANKDWKDNLPFNPNEESWGQSLGRQVLRSGARVGEAVAGLPGDILSGAGALGSYLSGGRLPNYQQIQEKLPYLTPPTSEDLRKGITQKATGQYLEPKNALERGADTIISDVATLWAPGKIASKGLKDVSKLASFLGSELSLGKAASMSIASNLAGWGAEKISNPALGATAKIGTLVLMGMPKAKEALEKRSSDLYSKVDSILAAEKPMVQPKGLSDKLNKMAHWAFEGIGQNSEAKKEIMDIVKAVDQQINNQGISIKNVWEAKKDITAKLGKLEKVAQPKAQEIKKSLEDILEQYGKKNKEFASALTEADALYSGLKTRSAINEAIKDNISWDKMSSKLSRPILLGAAYKFPGVAAGLATGAAAARKVGNIAEYIAIVGSNQSVRKYLGSVYKSALKNDKKSLVAAAKNLDKVLLKEEGRG